MSAKVTLPTFRISPAALGRRLASVILRSIEAELSPEAFQDTVSAVFNSCQTDDSTAQPGPETDNEILHTEQVEIEKSVRRSEIARRAAARRREMKEKGTAPEVKNEIQELSEAKITPETPPVEKTSSKRRRRNRRRKRGHGKSSETTRSLPS